MRLTGGWMCSVWWSCGRGGILRIMTDCSEHLSVLSGGGVGACNLAPQEGLGAKGKSQ